VRPGVVIAAGLGQGDAHDLDRDGDGMGCE
jgi:Excalibur calcium-binding domain